MKIVQSFWSKPYLEPDPSLVQDPYVIRSRLSAGWPHRILNYYSWALSCLQLRKFYDCVELVTDDFGKELLIDRLKLPYTMVSVALNDLDDYDPRAWALGKLYAYGLQDRPFLHVDGDIFIFEEFERELVIAPLVAQNPDMNYPGYAGISKLIWDDLQDPPACFAGIYKNGVSDCCNAGILGGNDIGFLQCFAREAFSFFEKNEKSLIRSLSSIDQTLPNIILEQALFYCFARHNDRPIAYLFPDVRNNPGEIGFFHAAEKNKGYVHCYGYYKGLRASCSQLEWKLQTEYPWYYQRINELAAISEI